MEFIDEHLDNVFTNLEVLEEYKFTVDWEIFDSA